MIQVGPRGSNKVQINPKDLMNKEVTIEYGEAQGQKAEVIYVDGDFGVIADVLVMLKNPLESVDDNFLLAKNRTWGSAQIGEVFDYSTSENPAFCVKLNSLGISL